MTHRTTSPSEAATEKVLNRRERIGAAEWIVAALGALLVLGSVAFLFHKALFSESRPAEITAIVTDMIVEGSGTLVTAEVRNRGGKSVAELTVTAVAAGEEKVATLDFVPAGSSRRIGFYFDGSEAPPAVELKLGGYREP